MVMKSNLPARFCIRVVDTSHSRKVLDVSSAENLLGKGDMLFLQPGTGAPVRGHGVRLKDSEINDIIEHAKAQGSPTYDDEVLTFGAEKMEGGRRQRLLRQRLDLRPPVPRGGAVDVPLQPLGRRLLPAQAQHRLQQGHRLPRVARGPRLHRPAEGHRGAREHHVMGRLDREPQGQWGELG